MDKFNLVVACQTCGYLIKDISNAYADAGYKVTIISSKKSQGSIKKSLKEGIDLSTVIDYDRSSFLKRILTWIICTIQIFFKIWISYKEHQVLYVSNPPLSPLLPLLLRNKYNILIWDIYPDVLVRKHIIGDSNILTKLWVLANKKVYKKAGHVFTISDGMRECLRQYANDDKIKVIPLWPDISMLHKIEKNENLFIKKNNLTGKFIVMYSGNMGSTHKMDVLVDVAKIICDKNILFIMIGDGAKKSTIKHRIENEGVNNILLLPYQPYDYLSHSLSAADIAVITLDTLSSRMSVPSKTFNMMALGAPLLCIASQDSELGNIVRKYEAGEIYQPEEICEMANYILKLKKDETERIRYSNNSLNASKHFCIANAMRYVI